MPTTPIIICEIILNLKEMPEEFLNLIFGNRRMLPINHS